MSKLGLGGTLYRGSWGQWSWLLHRITGAAVFIFLLLHILDVATIRISPGAFNAVMGIYRHPVMGLGEAVLVAAVVLHALNGVRIIIVDAWSQGAKYHKHLLVGVVVVFLILMAGFLPVHLGNTFGWR
ncbi:MAG: succinate dehydrogenase, cytochrome b556 subunit [Cellulomonadaceae bacterium]|nr:succinate dehydrogenase, cytochrome b556 subunit [Cellulomonadaceae bacterium]